MSEMLVEVAGDAADMFRAQFNIQNLEQARNAVSNLNALWSTPNPWSQRGHPEDRETFEWAGKEVEKRFESGRYKPEPKTQPTSRFSSGNKIAARKDGTFRAISKTPDVCKTPLGCSTPPVPYQVTADLSGSMGVVKNVRFNGKPAYVLNQSIVPTCTGDEPGSAKGVKSGTVGGEVKPIRGSSTVTIGRNPIIRDGDPCTMNSGNCTGIYVTAPTPSGSIDFSGNVVGDTNPPLEKEMLYQIAGFAKGAGGALWDMGEGFVNLAVGTAKLSPISEAAEEASKVTGLFNYRGFSETQDAVSKTVQTVLNNPKAIVDGLTKPYIEAWNQGNYGEALGRGAIDVGGLFVGGIGAVGKASETSNIAGKVSTTANVASAAEKTGEVSKAGVTYVAKAAEAKPAGDGLKVVPRDHPERIDYSHRFDSDLENFRPGYRQISGSLEDDLTLVSYHADVPLGARRSAKWWTSLEEGNGFFTIADIHQGLALPPEWGVREMVTIMRIPAGTDITAYVGEAAKQTGRMGEVFGGGSLQYRFKDFDPSWIIETRRIP